MFKNPFSFDGRIRRLEYGLTGVINIVIYLVAIGFVSVAGTVGLLVAAILYIAMIWFACAQNAKRCHDVGRSGWWQLIPLYGLFLLFQDGDAGNNEYGQNPKNPQPFQQLDTETLDGHLRN